MPFQGRSVMDEKREFVMLALAEGANVRPVRPLGLAGPAPTS